MHLPRVQVSGVDTYPLILLFQQYRGCGEKQDNLSTSQTENSKPCYFSAWLVYLVINLDIPGLGLWLLVRFDIIANQMLREEFPVLCRLPK